jgi:hypothetical protein
MTRDRIKRRRWENERRKRAKNDGEAGPSCMTTDYE